MFVFYLFFGWMGGVGVGGRGGGADESDFFTVNPNLK